MFEKCGRTMTTTSSPYFVQFISLKYISLIENKARVGSQLCIYNLTVWIELKLRSLFVSDLNACHHILFKMY